MTITTNVSWSVKTFDPNRVDSGDHKQVGGACEEAIAAVRPSRYKSRMFTWRRIDKGGVRGRGGGLPHVLASTFEILHQLGNGVLCLRSTKTVTCKIKFKKVIYRYYYYFFRVSSLDTYTAKPGHQNEKWVLKVTYCPLIGLVSF